MRESLIDVALGRAPADLVIRKGRLVNVNTAEIEDNVDVAIKDERIAYVGDAEHCIGGYTKIIDAEGQFLVPGLIDAHIHVESSHITVTELARVLVPRGITTVMEDPHEIANVLGIKGIKLILEEARNLPLKVYLRVPGRVPAVSNNVETSGGRIGLKETKELLNLKNAVALAGDVNPYLILDKNKMHLQKINYALSLNKTIAGQAPSLNNKELNAFIAAGPQDSHVPINAEEALKGMRLGMKAILTCRPLEMFTSEDLRVLARLVATKGLDLRLCLFCTDDKQVNFLVKEGGVDHMVRLAIQAGFDPVMAIQMATLNTAEHFKLAQDIGSIGPGKIGDIVILNDLEHFDVDKVLVNGKVVAERGRLMTELKSFRYPKWAKKTIKIKRKIMPEDLEIKVSDEVTHVKARVIVIGLPKREIITKLRVDNGKVLPNLKKDILNVAVIERHRCTGNIGRGFAAGAGIKRGAIASSVSHDAHNIITIGTNTGDMATCVNRLVEIGGGFVAACNKQVLGQVELQIAGLISEEPFDVVASKLDKLENLVNRELGCKLGPTPFFKLALVSLPNIPDLALTDKGLFDVRKRKIINVIKSIEKYR